MGNILRAIKLSKYNMLIKESFTLPNMRGDRDEIYLWYAAISEFKFELITQRHAHTTRTQTNSDYTLWRPKRIFLIS